MLIDTHAHLDGLGSEQELHAAFARARAAGITKIIAVGGAPAANTQALERAREQPGIVHAAVGFDRDQATTCLSTADLDTQIDTTPRPVAIGEIGLDYHYLPKTATAQERLFSRMLEVARRARRPVIVHSREAEEPTLALLTDHARNWSGAPDQIGVLHCFTGSAPFAHALTALGYHIGLSGILTFKNAGDLQTIAAELPTDRLLIETDSPYLAPIPHRGQRNEPAFLVEVARKLAAVRSVSLEDIAATTTANAIRLFGLDQT